MSSPVRVVSVPQPRWKSWAPSQECCDPEWESAYLAFETREQEEKKFLRRLRGFEVERWSRDLQIVELCCGRGSGLQAWQKLGFENLEGVDLSERLLAECPAPAQLYVGDCRQLLLPDASRDVVVVQGGLHHLPSLPDDVRATSAEAWRVLKPGGKFLVVEPWDTPFLRFVHWLCTLPSARLLWPRLGTLATMIEREAVTYHAWLGRPDEVWPALTKGFDTVQKKIALGKLSWLGSKPLR